VQEIEKLIPSFFSGKPISKSMCPQMAIPGKHLQAFVAGDAFYFHHVQIRIFKKAGCGLVPQIVKGHAGNFSSSACLDHLTCYGVAAHVEHQAVTTKNAAG